MPASDTTFLEIQILQSQSQAALIRSAAEKSSVSLQQGTCCSTLQYIIMYYSL